MARNICVIMLALVVTTVLLFGGAVPRTIDGSRIHVAEKKNLGLQENGRQTVLFVEDPAGLGPPSPDQYWTALLDSLLGVGNYGWFGPTGSYADNGPDLATMQGYELVVWNCYDCWDPGQGQALTGTDQTNIASYLTGGGKVWLIGQDVLFTGVPLSWMQTNFNLQSAVEDYGGGFSGATPFPVEGAGELSGYGFSFLVDWGSDVFPDDLTPNGSAHVVIHDAVNNADPSILSDDWSSSFWTVDGRNPTPWADWQEIVNIMLGGFGILAVEEEAQTIPTFGFSSIMPNPAMSNATISYVTSKAGPVTLRIYDASGRLVRTLVAGNRDSGLKTARWNGKDDAYQPVPGGCYFCSLSAEGRMVTQKIILMQ
jgi:hypothetical protein